jgi:hypothetical protein
MTTATGAPSCSLCSRLVVGDYEWGHGVGCAYFPWCKGGRLKPNHSKVLHRWLTFKGVGAYYVAKDGAREVIGESR